MIIPVKYRLRVYSNASFDLSLTWRDSNGNIIPLSTWTALMDFYISDETRTVVKSLTNQAGPIPSPAVTGIYLSDAAPNIYVFIESDETGVGATPLFTSAPGYYILHLKSDPVTVSRLLEGNVGYEL